MPQAMLFKSNIITVTKSTSVYLSCIHIFYH